MTRLTTRRTVAAALFSGVAMSSVRFANAQQGTPPDDHAAHHPGTPVPTPSQPMPGRGMQGTPGSGSMMPMGGDIDLMFIDMMTPHHEGAIAMSEVALERAEQPELADLAQAIIDSQQAEIEHMQSWREAWYPDAPVMSMDDMMGGMGQMMQGMPGMQDMTGMMGMGMMGMMDPEVAAEEMRAAPEPFDLAFINAMLPHHITALMMAEMMVQNAVHPELAELSHQMVAEQAAEISQMNDWRGEWYGTGATPTT